MFWILGAGSIVYALHRISDTGVIKFFATQLEHVEWEGMRFYDLIFPLFVFIVGVSIVFSLTRASQQPSGKWAAHKRVFKRTLLLYALAIIYSGGFSTEWPNIRLLGVLNRIALCYVFASLIFLHFRPRGIAVICSALLLGYWALMAWVPIPKIQLEKEALKAVAEAGGETNVAVLVANTTEKTSGAYLKGLNLANYLDYKYLPGKKWDVYWDPEGLLSTLPAIATCLLGIFAGLLIQNRGISDQRKVFWLIGAGAVGVVIGFLWGFSFPVIKKVWSSSYVLVAGGYSAILLGVFHQVIEVWKYQKWAQPFIWIGANAITLYLASNIIGFSRLANRFAGGDVKIFFDLAIGKGFGDLVLALVSLGLMLLLAWFLYRRKIFLRV